MHRVFTSEWRVDGLDRRFVGNIIEIAQDAPLVKIEFNQICRLDLYQPVTEKGECCRCCRGQGLYTADISKPGIVLVAKNPAGLPYRLLDGRHRLWAMQARGMTEAQFKVLELAQIKPYLKIDYDRRN